MSDLVGIEPNTLTNWNKDPEFLGQIKSAVAARLVKRLKRIERGEPGWQGTAWIVERLMPNRYSRPEVQISLSIGAPDQAGALKLNISLEEAPRIEAEPIRQAARRMIEDYQRRCGDLPLVVLRPKTMLAAAVVQFTHGSTPSQFSR